ncbi:MAG: hypothetical protein V1664_00625 [Candidatus Uhrbacteria bacterium]
MFAASLVALIGTFVLIILLVAIYVLVNVLYVRIDIKWSEDDEDQKKPLWFAVVLLEKKKFVLMPHVKWHEAWFVSFLKLDRLLGYSVVSAGTWVCFDNDTGEKDKILIGWDDGSSTDFHGNRCRPTPIDGQLAWARCDHDRQVLIDWARGLDCQPDWKTWLFYLYKNKWFLTR